MRGRYDDCEENPLSESAFLPTAGAYFCDRPPSPPIMHASHSKASAVHQPAVAFFLARRRARGLCTVIDFRLPSFLFSFCFAFPANGDQPCLCLALKEFSACAERTIVMATFCLHPSLDRIFCGEEMAMHMPMANQRETDRNSGFLCKIWRG